MIVESLIVGMFATNCYIVSCPHSSEGIIIDPGAGGKMIIDKARSAGLKIKYVVNTHGHVDHVAANGKLKEALGAPILLNEKDLELYNNPGFGLRFIISRQPEPERFLCEGDRIDFGNISLAVIETPGHTPGGICLYGQDAIFTGDTLFAGSIGRTDLAGGSYPEILKSIKEKILVLPDDSVVYPGHGPASSLEKEIRSNMFIANLT